MPQKTYHDVIAARDDLMRRATLDTRKWCVAPASVVGRNRHSDQHWMERFSAERLTELDATIAHRFLVSFQLTNRVAWDKERVAAEIRAFVSREMRNPLIAIATLAAGLRESNGRRTRQTSAASKVGMFAKPAAPVFIWDGLTACSARARDWYRAGQQTPRHARSVFRDDAGEHDYGAHHSACARALADERARDDFNEAVADIERFLLVVGGPMGDRALVPANFVERRLLDKLMFWEGWLMRKGSLPCVDLAPG